MKMKILLHEIAVIEAGHPFRGAIPEHKTGDCQVIQVRDISEDGVIDWTKVVSSQITSRKQPQWLIEGNIIFAFRGPRNLATCIPSLDRQVVCAQHFFRVILKDANGILPEFVAWQLNQAPLQRYFRQSAEGSSQVSIRRAVLEQAIIILPPIEKQRQLVAMHRCVINEKQVLQQLIDNRQQQLEAVAIRELSQ